MDKEPIGILDSGVGGLSVLKEIRKKLPGRELIYIGDSAWCPYGSRSPDEICQRVGSIVDYLHGQGVELVVIACNSATIHAVEWLRSVYPIPFVGMEPGVKPACAITETGVVGVLATEASIAGEKFLKLVDTMARDINVITQPCPMFVEFVEQGELEGDSVNQAIATYTQPLIDKDADVLVLGCTHYPFLADAIRCQIPDHVTLLDTGEPVAQRVVDLLADSEPGKDEAMVFIKTTGKLELLESLVPRLLPDLDNFALEYIEI